MRRSALLTVCFPLACNDPSVDAIQDPFEPACDGDGLVELLRLADDEDLALAERAGDGDVHVIVQEAATDPPAEGATRRLDAVIDRCGGERTEVVSHATSLRWWGEVLVGCVDYDLVQLRGYDDPSPTLLARRGCAARPIGEWYVTLDAEPGSSVGRMLALRPVGAEVETRVRLDDWWVDSTEGSVLPAIAGDRVFAQDPALALRSVDPATGEIAVELDAVAPGRWHLQGDLIAYRSAPLDPAGADPLRVRDRVTGTERILDAGVSNGWSFGFRSETVLRARRDALLPPTDQRWFWLDSLEEIVPPPGTAIIDVRADGLVWLSRVDPETFAVDLLRWRAPAAPQLAMSCSSCGASPPNATDHLDVIVRLPVEDRYELWHLPDADGPAVLVADGVGNQRRELADGRVLTVPAGADSRAGPLLLFPGDGGPAVTLLPRVSQDSLFLTSWYDLPDDEAEDVLIVTAPDEGSTGLYRAQLAPRSP